ncbi:hypothetical protein FRC10_005293, partial [Ceratobasidium sp. 414]
MKVETYCVLVVKCAYDDELDQLREEVETGWGKIQQLEEEVATLRMLRSEVKALTLGKAENDVKEICASVATLVQLLQSGANNAGDQSVAERLALGGALGAVAASVATLDPDPVPGLSKVKRLHKKKGGEVVVYESHEERYIVDHFLQSKVSRDIREPVKNADGTWNFWAKDDNGVEVLRPVWTSDLGDNEHPKWGWVQRFVAECQDVGHMKQHQDFLVKVPPSNFVSTLKRSTWTTLTQKWNKIQAGTAEEKEMKRREQGRKYAQSTTKKDSRNVARNGTVLEGPEFDFIGSRKFQSPEASDAENENHKVIDQPLYRSELLIRILDVLSLKHKLSKTKPSPATKADIAHYKTNSPIPSLPGGLCIARWGLSDDWVKNNPKAFAEGQCYVNMEATNPPDITQLLMKFPPRPRTCIPHRPLRAKGPAWPPSPPHAEPQSEDDLPEQLEGPVQVQLEVQLTEVEERVRERVEERVEGREERVEGMEEQIEGREERVEEQHPAIDFANIDPALLEGQPGKAASVARASMAPQPQPQPTQPSMHANIQESHTEPCLEPQPRQPWAPYVDPPMLPPPELPPPIPDPKPVYEELNRPATRRAKKIAQESLNGVEPVGSDMPAATESGSGRGRGCKRGRGAKKGEA